MGSPKMATKLLLASLSILFIYTFGQPSPNSTWGPSPKKGIVVPYWPNHRCGDFQAFNTASWWYNYHTTDDITDQQPWWCKCPDPGEGDPPHWCMPTTGRFHHVPMIVSPPGTGQRPDWAESDPPVADHYDVILGFNEPNQPDHGDLPPEQAAVAWMEEIQLKYPDKILVAPATAGMDTDWMDKFMEACEILGCRIDYVATHSYTTGNVNQMMNRLEEYSNRYHRKVWLTEFAMRNTYEEEKIVEYVTHLLPRLEAADFVWRYSWFLTRYYPGFDDTHSFWLSPNNSLVEQDSPTLTAVGEAYNHCYHCEI